MIKDFENAKKQLKELAEVLNSFKSEAVQLKIVELLFQRADNTREGHVPHDVAANEGSKPSTKSKGASQKAISIPRKGKAAKTAKLGAGAMVTRLIEEGYFNEPKTIGEIIEHCKSAGGHSFKPSEMSVATLRAIRAKLLKREKNEDHQFEYAVK